MEGKTLHVGAYPRASFEHFSLVVKDVKRRRLSLSATLKKISLIIGLPYSYIYSLIELASSGLTFSFPRRPVL